MASLRDILQTGARVFSPAYLIGEQAQRSTRPDPNAVRGAQQASSATSSLAQLLRNRASTLQNQDPRNSATFQAGRGTLRDLLRDRTRSDAGAAAARGLTGSEFEIAQGANRGRTASEFLRSLFGQAESAQRAERGQAFGQAIQGQGLANQMSTNMLGLDQRRRRGNQDMIANAVMNAVRAFGGA